ncbi:MAG TPA: hypothetical protein DCO79_03535 [Spirochaeta sp.]|nr:hypothetical protein [Spirochaeta sp.]
MEELDKLADDWQGTIDLMAQIIDVPAGLIMRLHDGFLEVFVSSQTEHNPFEVGDSEAMDGSGLYCESVIKTNNMLKIPNALKDDDWKDSHEIASNMISYLGFPVHWPDGRIFGTICVLDDKENNYSGRFEDLVERFKSLIEKQLEIIEKNKQLKKFAEIDSLTGILNRRTMLHRAQAEFDRSMRYSRPFSLIIFDLDYFKAVNDNYGHQAGDEVLKTFAAFIGSLLRTSDIWGRYGGEEFIAVLSETDYETAKSVALRFNQKISELSIDFNGKNIKFTVSAGVGTYEEGSSLSDVIRNADDALYHAKRAGRNRIK